MVRQYLHRCEEGRHDDAPEVASAIAQDESGYGGRDEAEGQQLPDVSCGDDDEVVAREGPQHSAQSCHPGAEVKGTQQDVEAQQHHEHVGSHGWQSQLIDGLEAAQRVGARVGRAHLIGGHAREERVRPSGALSVMSGAILFHFHVAAHGCAVVVARQDEALRDGLPEVGHADGHKEDDGQRVGQDSL